MTCAARHVQYSCPTQRFKPVTCAQQAPFRGSTNPRAGSWWCGWWSGSGRPQTSGWSSPTLQGDVAWTDHSLCNHEAGWCAAYHQPVSSNGHPHAMLAAARCQRPYLTQPLRPDRATAAGCRRREGRWAGPPCAPSQHPHCRERAANTIRNASMRGHMFARHGEWRLTWNGMRSATQCKQCTASGRSMQAAVREAAAHM